MLYNHSMARHNILVLWEPSVGHYFLITEVSPSHSDTPRSVGLLWKSDQPYSETSALQHTTLTRDIHLYRWAGIEPAIPVSELPQSDASDPAATVVGIARIMDYIKFRNVEQAKTMYLRVIICYWFLKLNQLGAL